MKKTIELTDEGRAFLQAKKLTPREIEIVEGCMNLDRWSDLSRLLGITEKTIKFHSSNLNRKLGVVGRMGVFRTLAFMIQPAGTSAAKIANAIAVESEEKIPTLQGGSR